MSLKIRSGGVFIASTIIPIAIPKRTRKFRSKARSLSLSQTTMNSKIISEEEGDEVSEATTLTVS